MVRQKEMREEKMKVTLRLKGKDKRASCSVCGGMGGMKVIKRIHIDFGCAHLLNSMHFSFKNP